MSLDTERKAHDLVKIRELLDQYGQIELLSCEGDPPERYEFAFHLQGAVSDSNGQPGMAGIHRIQLQLPFGYPHLPPVCRPLTSIFHPNVDPDAVQIGDFWHHERDLADLLLHLGRMLCGEVFETSDPFNAAAATWYAEHANELPWERLEPRPRLQSPPDDTAGASQDTMLFMDWTEGEAATGLASAADAIRAAMEERRFHAARELLRQNGAGLPEPDRLTLQAQVDARLREGEQLLLAARTHDQAGQGEAALRLLEQLSGQVADMPGLPEELQQIRERSQRAPRSAAPSSSPPPAAPVSHLPPPVGRGWGRLLFVGVVLVLLALAGTWVVLQDRNRDKAAALALQQASDHLRQQLFDEAREKAELGLARSQGLILPASAAHRQVRQALEELLASRELVEGLKGNVVYQGAYLPRETIKTLEEAQAMVARAEALATNKHWQEAAVLYEKALGLLSTTGDGSGQREQELRLRLARTKLQTLLQGAQDAEASTNWQEAAKHYREASDLAQSLDEAIGQSDFERRIAEVELRHLLEQARRSSKEHNWSAAADFYRRGIALIDATGVIPATRDELQRGLARARYGQLQAEGKLAADKLAWETAIRRYDEALALLREFPHLKDEGDPPEKIRRSRLMALLTWERQQADDALRRKNLVEEGGHLRRMMAEIDRNDVAVDNQLRQTRQEAAQRLAVLEQEEVIDRLSRQLLERFNDIFLENYPSIRSSKLLQPRVSFVRYEGRALLFNMQCTEQNEGRYFRLELNYLYDPAAGNWRLAPAGMK